MNLAPSRRSDWLKKYNRLAAVLITMLSIVVAIALGVTVWLLPEVGWPLSITLTAVGLFHQLRKR